MAFEMDPIDAAMAKAVDLSIQNAATNTARSAQAANHQMGISNLGHCQNYAVLMTKQAPYSDVVDKSAAFFGTVAGEAIERQLMIDHPEWIIQKAGWTVFKLPSGGEIPGTPDIVVPSWAATPEFPQGIYDLKSKSQMETIRKTGQSRQQKFQLAALAKGKIDDGALDPGQPIRLADVYFDRSGTTHEAFALGEWYDEAMVYEIDDWVQGVIYAVTQNEDGMREPPRTFCESYCEFFTVCRGQDTDVTGLIEDEEVIAAIDVYKEQGAIKTAAGKKQDAVKPLLSGVSGSTGKWQIRTTVVEGGEVSYFRPSYGKISITKVAPPKVKAAPKTKAVKK